MQGCCRLFVKGKSPKELELRLGREACRGVHGRLFSSAYLGDDDDLDERVYMRWIVHESAFEAAC
jgi:hypothetical protein